MIWTRSKPSRPSSRSRAPGRGAPAGKYARSAKVAILALVLSETAMAFSLLRQPAVGSYPTSEEPPGYGVSGYFSLEGDAGAAIRVDPSARTARPSLDIRIHGGRVRVTSPRAGGGLLALRLIDARGRLVRSWSELLPPGGAAVLSLEETANGLLFLHVEGGELGRGVKIIPPVGGAGAR